MYIGPSAQKYTAEPRTVIHQGTSGTQRRHFMYNTLYNQHALEAILSSLADPCALLRDQLYFYIIKFFSARKFAAIRLDPHPRGQ